MGGGGSFTNSIFRPLDKSAYRKINFFISHPKHMLRVQKRDTDSNKSFDFLLNPICIVVVLYLYSVLFVYLSNIIQIK